MKGWNENMKPLEYFYSFKRVQWKCMILAINIIIPKYPNFKI